MGEREGRERVGKGEKGGERLSGRVKGEWEYEGRVGG